MPPSFPRSYPFRVENFKAMRTRKAIRPQSSSVAYFLTSNAVDPRQSRALFGDVDAKRIRILPILLHPGAISSLPIQFIRCFRALSTPKLRSSHVVRSAKVWGAHCLFCSLAEPVASLVRPCMSKWNAGRVPRPLCLRNRPHGRAGSEGNESLLLTLVAHLT
jgi:hypothetical protein